MKVTITFIAFVVADYLMGQGYPFLGYLLIGFALTEFFIEAFWLPRKKRQAANSN